MLEKEPRWISKKWTDAARGQDCTMNLPCCNYDPSTTSFAHENGAGMGRKADDYNGADMCDACHAVWDGRARCHGPDGQEMSQEELYEYFYRARMKTIRRRLVNKIFK